MSRLNLQRRYLRQMTTPEIRKEFTDFFVKEHDHIAVKSSSLIPHNDKSLMFTNAGMVQFKEYFRNPAVAPFKQATSIQKCMRAGGKHNDLDNVGYTPRHHTFFEMLGNFSFGQYSKAGAIQMAWRFLTEIVQLPKDRLRVTVLASDQESYDLWKNQEGIPEEKIIRCDTKDNFWTMGEGAGPCGPCTEIFWDTRNDDLGEDRWLEIWNLVFMQHYKNDQGQLENLPIVCVDTGMGLERLASVVQSKDNNYETDVFGPIFEGLHKTMIDAGIESSRDINATPHKKIIVDHLRSMSFLIADGVIPSNVGRGYVLRRIIRRALRSGNQLGFNKPFMADLYGYLLESFKDGSYPELTERQDSIKGVIHQEEEIFMSTLSKGLALLEPVFKQKDLAASRQVPAEIAFKLYDTFGFPLDLTVVIAEERGWTVDLGKVEQLKQKQQEQGRASWKSTSSLVHARAAEWKDQGVFPTFSGYHRENLTGQSSTVLAAQSTEDGTGDIILSIEPCPFYGLGGGQSPDTGMVKLANGSEWRVVDVFSPYERGLAIRIQPASTEQESVMEEDLLCLHKGFQLTTFVDTKRREGVAAHHSATHMLNAALRKTLGKPIMQAGSLVEPERLRFDFTHGKPISPSQTLEIENWINAIALQSVQPMIQEYPLQKAIDMGSIAVFSEKYGEVVRVVDFPKVSMELCGGTHVEDLSKIYPFKILSEGSVAAGTRRIEAAVGRSATQFLIEQDRMVTQLNQDLKAYATSAGNGLDLKVNKMKDQVTDLSRQYGRLLEKLIRAPATAPIRKGTLNGLSAGSDSVPVQIHELDGDIQDQDYFSKKANFLKEQEPDAVHILIWKENMVVTLDQKRFPSLHAGKVLKTVLEKSGGGKGGGQGQLARGRLADGEVGLSKLIQLTTSAS
ncbi:hypothetical protein BGZ83_004530 [Gryganskiella cystojenkinii]|nr:hypothetical protein BGZ83_004530 [Gryganskiella cystojenkinii]